MGVCHGAKNSSIENENLEIFSLIWLDTRINKSQKSIQIQQQLRTIINHFKTFQNENECQEYLKQISKNEYIIFIINDQIGQKLIPLIHHLEQIISIYIYSSNQNLDQSWINQFNKIKCICINSAELINQIKIDQTRCKHIIDPILFDTFRIENSNDQFSYSQILIDVLLELEPLSNDMIDFLSRCRNQYKGNKYYLTILREFQQNYSSDHAIWWYTREIFISQLLNKALRVQNMDFIFLLRFFIHDIEQQLKECQCLTPIQVYRYQLMSNRELQVLKDSIGQFISINIFLLTNVNRDSVLPYSNLLPNIDNFQSILFEINADPSLENIKPFANITIQSYSNKEQEEVLFMLGSIFQLNNIHQDDNEIWIIEMSLASKTNLSLKSTFDNYKNDDDDDTNLLSFGYILQKMNKLDEAEKYYHRLFHELPDDDERIACCCFNLGNVAYRKTDYNSSLEWLSKSLNISLRTLQSNDTFLALIYNSMGCVYNAKHDSKAALEFYDKAVIIWKQSIDDNYSNIAECLNNIGIIYKQEKNYSVALEYFKQTLSIMKNYVSDDHLDLSKSHGNIASIYRLLEQYNFALEHYNLSLKIIEKHYSGEHPNIAKALGNIGITYALKGEQGKALLCYEKAAEIYRHTLPPVHINNIKIEQLIQNAASPQRKIAFGSFES